MGKPHTIWLLFFSMLTSPALAQEDSSKPRLIEFNGYLKDLQEVYFVNGFDSLSSVNLVHNRLNFKFNFSGKLSGRLEIRNRIFYGDQLKRIPDFGHLIDTYNGIVGLSHLWVNQSNLVVHSVIDRLLLQYQTENWDLKVGRQRINWGINNVWNPNDIFNAYDFLDFDYEERTGNDAVRVQHYLKNNAVLELAWKPGKHKNESIAAALYKFNRNKYDYQLLAGVYQNDLVVGGGWAGNIKEAGFKGELSYFHPRQKTFDTSGVLSFSVMADKTFKNDWYVSVSALYNSHPSNSIFGTGSLISSNLSAKALFPFRYSFYAGVRKAFTPISSLNISAIYSPTNNTLVLFPSWTWNLAKNVDVDITAQSFFSDNEQHRYKAQGTAFFFRGKWNF